MRIQKRHRNSPTKAGGIGPVLALCAALSLAVLLSGCSKFITDGLAESVGKVIRTHTDAHIDAGGGNSETQLQPIADAIVAEIVDQYDTRMDITSKSEENLKRDSGNVALLLSTVVEPGKKLSDSELDYAARVTVGLVGAKNEYILMAIGAMVEKLSGDGNTYAAEDLSDEALLSAKLSCGDAALQLLNRTETENLIVSVSDVIANGIAGGPLKSKDADVLAEQVSFAASNAGVKFIPTEGSYDAYLLDLAAENGLDSADALPRPDREIVIPADTFTSTDMEGVEVLSNYEGKDGASVKVPGSGYIEYTVNVPETGLYNLALEYFTIEDRTSQITRDIMIDGKLPFDEAEAVEFSRIWKDMKPVSESTDSRDSETEGNQIRSEQEQVPSWREQACRDSTGYYDDDFLFWLTEGTHTLRLVSKKESTVMHTIRIFNETAAPDYQTYLQQYGDKSAGTGFIKVQAENSYVKSNLSIYPTHDRTSPLTEDSLVAELDSAKFDYNRTKLNVLGGDKWKFNGQWISWQVDVPGDGMYKIILRGRQNINTGMTSSRRLTIDGVIPFAECSAIPFVYSDTFKMEVLGGDDPYLFYLTKGTHTLTLQNVLGENSEIARRAQASVRALNTAYRRVLVLTGSSPDENRDYHIETALPEVIEIFSQQAVEIRNLSQLHYSVSGERDSNYAMLQRIALRLDTMAKRPFDIAKNFGSFKSDIGSIGTYILALQLQPYEMDYLMVAQPDFEIPRADAGFFKGFGHEIKLFISSFVNDYSMVGGNSKDKNSRSITVWYGAGTAGAANLATGTGGREQAQIIKQMIDDSFVPEHDIDVNMQFIAMSALLPATLAGKGPDVALQIGGQDPMTYAMRNAVVDLTKFKDFNEVKDRFYDSAMVQYSYQGGIYALPETQTFNVMFYRKDIMEELGLEIPRTWDQIKRMLPELQKRNMNFGFPVNSANTRLQSFITLLYQRGGDVYKNEFMQSNLDSQLAVDTFIYWTDLYLSYKMPYEYNYENRIRTGEMPIVVADNAQYNVLSISAPEIRGLWGFTLAPASDVNGDGVLSKTEQTITTSGSGCMMLSKTKDEDAAWQFMKWWTSADVQSRFAIEVESTLGTAARYPSANKEVLANMPWSSEEYKIIMQSLNNTKGIPEVPGGYYTPRHIDNAFNRVVLSKTNTGTSLFASSRSTTIYDARETLLDFVKLMNEELYQKRKEYGLSVIEPGAGSN